MKGPEVSDKRPDGHSHLRPIFGRGRGRSGIPPQIPHASKSEAFKGIETTLPVLNYGGPHRDNRPIEFLASMGEYTGVKYESTIAPAFWNIPPSFGAFETEPVAPMPIDNQPTCTILIQEYLHVKKHWINVQNDTIEQRKSVFCLVYGQLSESSRAEIQDHAEWKTNFESKYLLYLINRIRSTHVAKQSGNPSQDKERVRATWANLRMAANESSFSFRTRVENYQLERTAVGLAVLPDEEIIIGILNRLDMSRYSALVANYLDNERRGICSLPDTLPKLWKELKDAQIVRFRGAVHPSTLESVFISAIEQPRQPAHSRRITTNTGRGRGRG
jgi:hypothetical protein